MVENYNYYQVYGWMVNELQLKGYTLSVYAIIFGFTQDGESEFKGGVQYLCDFCGGVSKPTIINSLKELTDRGYLIRRDDVVNNVTFPRYRANLPLVKNFYGVVKNLDGGGKNFLPHNKSDNNIDINNHSTHSACGECVPVYANTSTSTNTNTAPTLEQIKALCYEMGYCINVDRFFTHYSKFKWLDTNGKPLDWRKKAHEWDAKDRASTGGTLTDEEQRMIYKPSASKKEFSPNAKHSYDPDDFLQAAVERTYREVGNE